jgi:hypothetical protein
MTLPPITYITSVRFLRQAAWERASPIITETKDEFCSTIAAAIWA